MYADIDSSIGIEYLQDLTFIRDGDLQVMDEHWEEGIEEFSAVNVTGFRIVDESSGYVREFLKTWKNLKPHKYPGAGKYISVSIYLYIS